ncbi:MAG: hypothetical protein KGJ88_12955 [Verrucomicrobiota bacterium]|nr:hypothetical protein [Verrucomicrobiota bacterium]
MKHSISIIAITFAIVGSCLAADTQPQPRYVAVVTCFNGKLDSGSFCSATPTQEPQQDSELRVSRGLTCGWPGKVSELHWEFVGQKGQADVYRITRRFPSDMTDAVTTTNTVLFTGNRVTVFKDKYQVIVMEPPKDLKTKQPNTSLDPTAPSAFAALRRDK